MAKLKHKFGVTYYEKKGKKGETPIVCLHGGPGGMSKKMTPLFELSNDRQVFLYDQIGGGRSTAISEKQCTIETFVEELDILVKHWKLDEFYLMGGSWGTTLALEYYLRKGKKVKGLIFQSPMFSARDWQEDANILIEKLPAKYRKIINYCHEIGATDSKVYKEAIIEYYSRHVFRNKKKLLENSKKKNTNAHGEKVYEYMWGPSEFMATGTLSKYNRVKDLKKIKVPTLFICGQYDEATPVTASRYVEKIKGSKLKVIKGASHSILSEKPKDMLKVMRDFLK